MSQESAMRALATHLFDCVESNDMDGLIACYSPGAKVWNNYDEQEIEPGDIADRLKQFDGLVTDKKYEQRELRVYPGGFVQRHRLCGTRKTDGERVEMPACLVAEVKDGRIVRSFDYIDSAKLGQFMK